METLTVIGIVLLAGLIGLWFWRNCFGTDDYFPFFRAVVDDLQFVDPVEPGQ